MCALAKDIGIDLGTASVPDIHQRGQGALFSMSLVVAMDKNTGKLLKVGADAQAMLGRNPLKHWAIRRCATV